MRPETIKFLEENIGSKFLDISHGDNLEKDNKSKSNRTSGNKKLLHNSEKATYWVEKVFAYHVSSKGPILKIYGEIICSTAKKTIKLKTGQKIWGIFSEENTQMSNKYMKRCSTLIIMEMQTKITVKYHFTPVRMVIIKKIRHNKCWKG